MTINVAYNRADACPHGRRFSRYTFLRFCIPLIALSLIGACGPPVTKISKARQEAKIGRKYTLEGRIDFVRMPGMFDQSPYDTTLSIGNVVWRDELTLRDGPDQFEDRLSVYFRHLDEEAEPSEGDHVRITVSFLSAEHTDLGLSYPVYAPVAVCRKLVVLGHNMPEFPKGSGSIHSK
jgi:hypothetical protein